MSVVRIIEYNELVTTSWCQFISWSTTLVGYNLTVGRWSIQTGCRVKRQENINREGEMALAVGRKTSGR